MKRFNLKSSIKENKKGIALVLSVLILSNLLMITLVVSDVILRISRASREIRDSEIAYLAAESAVEKAVYSIEKGHDATGLGIASAPTTGSLGSTSGSWRRYIAPIFTLDLTCFNSISHESIFPVASSLSGLSSVLGSSFPSTSCLFARNFDGGPLTSTDWLTVMLAPGDSFELEYTLNVPSNIDYYPNHMDIDWTSYPGGSSRPAGLIISLTGAGQTSDDTGTMGTLAVSATGNFGTNPNHKIRIINNHTEHVLYNFKPRGSAKLPVGISVTAKGYYGTDQKERIIVSERRHWEIY